MKVEKTGSGNEVIYRNATQKMYVDGRTRLLSPSSDHDALWNGAHRLSRAEVAELVAHLQAWMKTGSLRVEGGE